MHRTLLNRLIQVASVGLAALLLLCWLNWSFLTRLKAGSELRGFARVVRRSTLTLEEKERLLNEIEHLEDQIDLHESVDLVRWWQHAQAIQDVLYEGIVGDAR